MKPAPFDWFAPREVEEAVALLARHGPDAKPLAGGQSLVPAMNFRLARPAVLVDLNGIDPLFLLEASADGGLRIGAMARQAAVERSALVRERAPLLAEALRHVAHPQIRNRGTVGGSAAHADPAAEVPAALLVLRARLRALGPAGERTIAAAEFFVGPFATDLAADELLAAIEIPPPPPRAGAAFVEAARRHGDFALAGAAALVALDDEGRCSEARLALFGVAGCPVSADEAAVVLVGERAGEGGVDGRAAEAAAEAAGRIDPPADVHASAAYRRHLAEVLARRALGLALRRAAGGPDPLPGAAGAAGGPAAGPAGIPGDLAGGGGGRS